MEAASEHLADNPYDWAGAYAALMRAFVLKSEIPAEGVETPTLMSWYDERERGNAEALLRDDIPILTAEVVDPAELASAPADIRFSFGMETRPIFRDIAEHLAAVRKTVPDVLNGVGHFLYYHPEVVAAYVRAQSEAG